MPFALTEESSIISIWGSQHFRNIFTSVCAYWEKLCDANAERLKTEMQEHRHCDDEMIFHFN